MNSRLKIRELLATDENHLFNLRNDPELLKWYQNPKSVSEVEHSNWMKIRLTKYPSLTLVAEKGPDIVGTAYLTKKNNYEISVAVNPSHQSQGIGSSLIELLIDKSRLLNINEIYAVISNRNSNSQLLFKSFGFKKFNNCDESIEQGFTLYRLNNANT